MAGILNKLFVSGNYIISEKNNGVDPIQRTEFAVGHTVYTRGINGQFPGGADQFEIIEGGVSPKANGRLVIPVTEVDPDLGVWYDETGLIKFTASTLTTFLRVNSGFNTASGGSGATGPLEIVVEMDADQILQANPANTGMFELIPQPGATQFIALESVLMEFTDNGVVYTMVSTGWLIQYANGAFVYVVDKSVCTTAGDQIRNVRLPFTNDTVIPKGTAVGIISSDILGFTLGNGTLKITLRYFVKDFI